MEERLLAGDVVRIADEALDLEYAAAVRYATEHPPKLLSAASEISKAVDVASVQIKADQERIDQTTKRLTRAIGPKKDALNQLLALQQARLEVDQQKRDDLKDELVRAGGDPATLLKRALENHKLSQEHSTDASTAPETDAKALEEKPVPTNFVAQITSLYSLHGKLTPLQQAGQETEAVAAGLIRVHDALKREIAARQQTAKSGQAQEPEKSPAAAEEIVLLRQQASDEKSFAELERRIENQESLATVYRKWAGLVIAQQRQGMRGLVRSGLWILFIVLAVYFFDRLLQRLPSRLRIQHTEFGDVSVIAHFATQAAGVLLVLAVVFGVPEQFPSAVFSVVGAGITVASKDIFLGFIDDRVRRVMGTPATKHDG